MGTVKKRRRGKKAIIVCGALHLAYGVNKSLVRGFGSRRENLLHTSADSHERVQAHKFNLASQEQCGTHTCAHTPTMPCRSLSLMCNHCAGVMKLCVLHSRLDTEPISQRRRQRNSLSALRSRPAILLHLFPLVLPIFPFALALRGSDKKPRCQARETGRPAI